jgi:DNA repair protein RadC
MNKPTQITMFAAEPKIKRLSEVDRPVYRLAHLGPQVLTNAELISLLIRGANSLETAEAILNRWRSPHDLNRASVHELQEIYGIGQAQAAAIQAAFELGRRLMSCHPDERPTIHSPSDAAALVQYEMSALEQEELRVILLDTRNHVIDIKSIYRGSVNSSQVRVGELFRDAIRQNAAAIIVLHNHPSGDPSPSPDDVGLTRNIVQAGKLLDIDTLDHLVIGQGRYVSLKERGLGFS